MIRTASTAALRYSSELLFLRQTRTAPPGWRSRNKRSTGGPDELPLRAVGNAYSLTALIL
jgi:hypothetical protein